MGAYGSNRTQLYNPVLTNFARQFKPLESGFIADVVAPRIGVAKEVGQYPVFDKQYFFGNGVNPLKPDRAPSKEIDIKWSNETYACEEYALNFSITERERRNIDSEVRLQQSKLSALRSRMLIDRERRVAAAFSGCTNSATISNNWNVDAGTIEADLVTAKEAIFDRSGLDPNALIIPYKVANAIAIQQDIRALLQYTVNAQDILRVGQNILPSELWGLKVYVAKSISTTDEDAASPSYAGIWGDEGYVAYIDPSADWGIPTAVAQFVTQDFRTRQWSEDNPAVDRFELSEIVDEKLTGDDLVQKLPDLLS